MQTRTEQQQPQFSHIFFYIFIFREISFLFNFEHNDFNEHKF